MKIILIHKAQFFKRPPVISVLTILKDLGHEVVLITTGLNDNWRAVFRKNGVVFYEITSSSKGIMGKILSYVLFYKKVWKIIDDIYSTDTILWVEGAYTIVALGKRLNKYRFILQIQELHEKFRSQLKAIARVINNAELVFMPEYNRTILYQVWFQMKKKPIVLPNKPYFVPSLEEIDYLKEKYAKYVSFFSNYKVLLYQGMIHPERDLSGMIKAVKELGDDYRVVLMGQDQGMVDKYKAIDDSLLHIPALPAPDYLALTSLAYIGLVVYDPMELNTTYCAPNKIYEYGYFGLPMIGNDIPGLKYTIEHSNAGVLLKEFDQGSFKKAVEHISFNYLEYSKNAKELYALVDNKKTIKDCLDKISLI